MQIAMIGINHKSGSLLVREKVTRYFLRRFRSSAYMHLFPSVLLTTCLRTELYFSSDDLNATHHYLLSLLREQLTPFEEGMLSSFFGKECFFHLSAVTAGLESLEKGESEIQRQVKEAYLEASNQRLLSSDLHYLFQKSLKLGKEMRSSLSFVERKTLPCSFLEKVEATFPDISQKKFLFVGASSTHQRIIRFLKSKGISDLTICNRTEEKAVLWAKEEGVKILPFTEQRCFFDYDVISFATKSEEFLLTKKMIPPLSPKKLIFDLSFPRNVDPSIASENLLLFSLENLLSSEEKRENALLWKEKLNALVEKQLDLFEKRQAFLNFSSAQALDSAKTQHAPVFVGRE